MRLRLLYGILLAGLLAACGGRSSIKPIEVLDESTGMSLGALQAPIELVQTGTPPFGKRASFAYVGPVEWNRMGEIRYGLWIHIAPGNGAQVADIHTSSALTLNLDDGPLPLTVIEPPRLGREAYEPVAPWGQTAYFELSEDLLKRLAASRRITLDAQALEGSAIRFLPSHDTHATLVEYARARRVIAD
jgi:hypothetical protein